LEPDPDPSLFQALFLWQTTAFDPGTFIGIAVVVMLLVCSALMSASEVAYFSLTQNDLTDMDNEDHPTTPLILKLLNQPRYLLSTILVGNNFVNVGIVIVSNFVILRLLNPDIPQWLYYFITVGLVTFFLVLFGEVTPKVYASFNKLWLARMMARPLLAVSYLLHPINYVLINTTNLIEKRLENNKDGQSVSLEDIDEAIDLTIPDNKSGSVGQEANILKGIVKFGQMTVTQIMCPRPDMTIVQESFDFEQLMQTVRDSGFSRLPVCDEDDQIIGIIHSKNLLEHFSKPKDFDWQSLIRKPALIVPEGKKIDDLLRQFQRERVHMGIVVDEFGVTLGLVTLEDIMEEIVGDIRDEFDDEQDERMYTQENVNNFTFKGRIKLHDMCRVLNLEADTFDEVSGDADTLAGLLLEVHGKFPRPNLPIRYKQFTFVPVTVIKSRIEDVKLTVEEAEVS
jgi:gliding motility-associated protein GldE